METIKNYLETMFSTLPNTYEVQKAKKELAQMMEDKYTELINDGKTDNEAVGIVISEFGNLDELAEDLGIKDLVVKEPVLNSRKVTMDEAKDFIANRIRYGLYIGLGVFLCINCFVCFILGDALHFKTDALGIAFMFLSLAIAVGLFVFSGITLSKWDFLKNTDCSLDFATTNYVSDQKENYRGIHALFITVGVILCITSVVPAAIFDELTHRDTAFGGIMLFIMVGAGVLLFICTCYRNGAYDILLNLNRRGTMGANFVNGQQEDRYSNETVATIMAFYWPTITCLYLIWSFLTFSWWKTWIIWPVAAIISGVIKKVWGEK